MFSDIFLMNWLLLYTCLFFCCKSSCCVWGTGGGASALPCQWWRKYSHSFILIFIYCALPCAVEFYFYLVKPMKLIVGQFLQLLMCLKISPSILSSYNPSWMDDGCVWCWVQDLAVFLPAWERASLRTGVLFRCCLGVADSLIGLLW